MIHLGRHRLKSVPQRRANTESKVAVQITAGSDSVAGFQQKKNKYAFRGGLLPARIVGR